MFIQIPVKCEQRSHWAGAPDDEVAHVLCLPFFLTLCLPLKSNPPSKKEERAVSNANNVYNSGEGEEAHIYELSVLVMTGIVVEGKLNDKCAVCISWGKGAGIALGS